MDGFKWCLVLCFYIQTGYELGAGGRVQYIMANNVALYLVVFSTLRNF